MTRSEVLRLLRRHKATLARRFGVIELALASGCDESWRNMACSMAMKIANIAEFKNHLSEYLAAVANGDEVEVRKRNTPLARVVPIRQPGRNRTVLGCGKGSVVVKADLTAPMIPDADWEMLGDAQS